MNGIDENKAIKMRIRLNSLVSYAVVLCDITLVRNERRKTNEGIVSKTKRVCVFGLDNGNDII